MTLSDTPPRSRRDQIVLLLVLVALAMGRVVYNDFVAWDDEHNLTNSIAMNPPSLATWAIFWNPTKPQYGLYVPLTYTVWQAVAWLDHWQSDTPGTSVPLHPFLFHLTSLLVHLAASVVVYRLLLRLIGRSWPACIGAALFAVHPVQVETIAWASGLKDLLCGFFTLAAVWAYVVAANEQRPGLFRRSLPWVLMILGLLSKPSAMVMPALAGIIDLLLLQSSWRTVARRLAPAVIILPILLAYTKWAQPGTGIPTLPIHLRPLLVGDSLAFYLSKLVWPVGLVFDYTRNPAYVLKSGQLWWTWLVPACVVAALLWRWPQRRVLLAAFLLLAAGVGPTLGWTPFLFQYYSTVADHYVYTAMFGAALAVAWALSLSYARPAGAQRAWLAAWVLVLALAIRSVDQCGIWADSLTLYESTMRINPRSFVTFNNRGVLYTRDRDASRAILMFDRAVAANPDYGPAYDHLALAYIALHDPARAFHYAKMSVDALLRMPPGLVKPTGLAESCGLLAQLYARGHQWDEVQRLVTLSLAYDPTCQTGLEAQRLLLAERAAAATRPTTQP